MRRDVRSMTTDVSESVQSEASLVAFERRRARAELGCALGSVPAAAARSLNPILWFRRYPVATGLLTVAGGVALVATVFSRRRDCPAPATHGPRRWLRELSFEVLNYTRRAVVGALMTRFMWRGFVSPDQTADEPVAVSESLPD